SVRSWAAARGSTPTCRTSCRPTWCQWCPRCSGTDSMKFSRPQQVAGVLIAAAGLAAAGFLLLPGPAQTHLTVYFRQTSGLYPGDRVLVLGVPVGRVDSITS